jgi:hypothetical protein
MGVVSDVERVSFLHRLRLSDVLIQQSSGSSIDPLLAFRCKSPPFFSYHGARCPEGPMLAPLWDCGNTVTAVWLRDGRPEFIEFDIEMPHEYRVIAHTEQGLWATVFVNLFEDNDELERDQFRPAAEAVGFRFLDRLVESYEAADLSTFESHDRFLRAVVGEIDHESGA